MRLAVLALVLVSLAMGPALPPPVKVAIQLYGSHCLDPGATATQWSHTTLPTLFAYGGRAHLGPVSPGTCAWIDGTTARSRVQLGCPDYLGGWLLSPAAVFAPVAGGAALCPVPAPQDFR